MVRRCMPVTFLVLALGGFAFADIYDRCLIIELTDAKTTFLVRVPGEKGTAKKVVALAKEVAVTQLKGGGEVPLPLAGLQKLVVATAKHPLVRGIEASVTTDDTGRVTAIRLAKGGLPEEAEAIFDKADRVELYSLEPEPDEKAAKDPKAVYFRGWLVLGKAILKGDKERKPLAEALDLAIGRGRVAKCFDPRHGIRATKGRKTVDVVICFRCGQAYFYYDPKKEDLTTVKVVKGMQPVLDEILKAAGVPLAVAGKE